MSACRGIGLNKIPARSGETEDAFIAHLAVERNLSPRTLESYGRDLRQFAGWTEAKKLRPARIDRAAVRSYLGERRDAGLSARSAARALSSIRGLFRFLVASEALESDPTANIRSPSLWRTVPHALSTSEVDALLAEERDNPHPEYGSRSA